MLGRLEEKTMIAKFSVFILALYVALSFIFSDFSVSAVLGVLWLCIWCGLVIIQGFLKISKEQYQLTKSDVISAVFPCVVGINVIRSGIFSRTVMYYGIILAVSMLLYILSQEVPNKLIFFTKVVLVSVATVFAIINILYVFFPETIKSTIFSIFSSTSVEYNERILGEGYGIAFGEDVGYTAVMIVVGIGILFISTPKCIVKMRGLLIVLQFFLAFALNVLQRRGEILIGAVALAVTAVIMLISTKKAKMFSAHDKRSFYATILIEFLCIIVAFFSFVAINPNNSIVEMNKTVTEIANQVTDESTDIELENKNSIIDEETSQNESFATEEAQPEENSETSVNEKIESLGNGRIILWKMAWNAFLEKPIFGHGWGFFSRIAPESGNTHATNAHCVYLQLLCETGIVGFLLIGSVFLYFLVSAIVRAFSVGNMTQFINTLVALFLILFMLGEGVVDNSLYYPYWMILISIALILLFKTKEKTNE